MDEKFEHSGTTCAGCVLNKPDKEHCSKCREYYMALPKIVSPSCPATILKMFSDNPWSPSWMD